jgi:hypothetical protein
MVFRAVALPAGRHVVEMVYRPRAALIGLGVTALTLALLAVALLRPRLRLGPGAHSTLASPSRSKG